MYIPHLVILNSEGKVLSDKGVQDIENHGLKAIDIWISNDSI